MHPQINCRWLRQAVGRSGLAAGLLLCLTACSQQPLLPPSLASSLPHATEISDLPYFPQQHNQCGPASLATVLSHSGVQISPAALRDDVYLPGRGGSLGLELIAQARRQARLVYPLEPTLQALLTQLASGTPVLVLQNLRFDWWPRWHFAVVMGYDLQRRQLLLRSGDQRRYPVDMGLFDRTWSRSGRWAIVVMHPHRPPITAQAAEFLRAAADLEETGQTDAARRAYGAALQRWPQQPLALLGLANTAQIDGDLVAAEDYYQRFLQRRPNTAEAWNNRAYALQRLGCTQAALASVSCAVALVPDSSNYRDSLQEVPTLPAPAPALSCPDIACP